LNTYLAPGLLVLIACFQIFAAFTNDQSAWKGGGFGMFSTVDSPSARFLKVYLLSGDEEEAVRVSPRLSRLQRIVRTVPTQENLELMARTLTEETWIRAPFPYLFYSGEVNDWQQDGTGSGQKSGLRVNSEMRTRNKLPQEPEFPAEFLVEYDAIRVELWKYRYEAGTATVRASKFAETVAARPTQ
jgi:hypothetical protein